MVNLKEFNFDIPFAVKVYIQIFLVLFNHLNTGYTYLQIYIIGHICKYSSIK